MAYPYTTQTTAAPLSVYGRPSATPSLDYATQGDQQGYYFVTNRGKPAKAGGNRTGFVPLSADAQYRLLDARNNNSVAASGTGEGGLQSVYSMAQQLSANNGKKANWAVEMMDPATNQWSRVADDPRGGLGATLKKIAPYALGGVLGGIAGVGALGGVAGVLGAKALGAGGSGGGGLNVNGLGTTNPIFSAQLPASNLAPRAPRAMPQQDWNTYASRPEQSFFTDVPQLARGGAVPHGRSDDVPAMLSNKEYVIDAETMALLGNGDPDAGADMMDQWRVNVRKHKGAHLSKGQISPNARMPEAYMNGGRK